MGIVYEDEINHHNSAYFSVDRMGGIQYNTIVRIDSAEKHIYDIPDIGIK